MDMSGVFSKIRNTLTNTVTEISSVLPGNPLLREYDAKDQIASGGPEHLWKVYKGFKKSTKAEVAIWVFEKKQLEQYSRSEREAIINVFKNGCMQLAKLKHPRVLTVEHVLEESRESLVMCTEPILGVVSNLLGKHVNMLKIPNNLKGYEMYDVEIKYGLLQICESLEFLHNSAKIIHGNICGENLVVTKDGLWKITGFDFTLLNIGTVSEVRFVAKEWNTSSPSPTLPNPNYIAPEYITKQACDTSSDIYSVGVLLYSLYYNGSTIFSMNHKTIHREMNRNIEKLQILNSSLIAKIPTEAHDHIKMLLHPNPEVRPTASQMLKLPFFESVGVKTLQYLDSLLQRDNLQRSQFFKSLGNVLPKLPKRIKLQRLIPALNSELSNHNMIPFLLPNIFAVAEDCNDEEYIDKIFPCLIPVFKVHDPIQIVFQLLKKMDFLLKRTPASLIQVHILPMISASLESSSIQIQELSLSIIPSFSKELDISLMKNNILPKIRKIMLSGSTAAIRVNSLVCIGKLITSFDKWTAQDEVLMYLHQIKSSEPGVLMAMLGVYKTAFIDERLGITKEMISSKSLPFLIPLAFQGSLNLKQFNSFMSVIKEMMKKIENEQRSKLEEISKMKIQEDQDLEFTKAEEIVDSQNKLFSKPVIQEMTIEEKKLLASQKVQEIRMKNTGPVNPIKVTSNLGNRPQKPKDLTSTLLWSQPVMNQSSGQQNMNTWTSNQQMGLKPQNPTNPYNHSQTSYTSGSSLDNLLTFPSHQKPMNSLNSNFQSLNQAVVAGNFQPNKEIQKLSEKDLLDFLG